MNDGSSFEADLCIIGAGAAGITIAKELKDSKLKILLLESGGLAIDPKTQALYEGQSAGLQNFPSLAAARLRYFGGTTGHWNGWCAPLDPIDFEKREWIAHSGWPIKYPDLEPWYRRAQQICQLGPFEYGAEYWENQSGFRRLPLAPQVVDTKIIQFSPPTRFGTVYREEILQAPNITLWTFANVTDIRSNPGASHVTGVEVTTLNAKKMSVKAKKYILACGGLENPRILLLSNKAIPHGLGNRHDLVGRFFIEHPHLSTSRMLLPNEKDAAFYTHSFQPDYHKYIPLLGIPPAIQKARKIANYSSVIWPQPLAKGANAGVTYQMSTRLEQVPNPESRITLDPNKKDELGQPQLRLDWRMTQLDKQSIRIAEQLIANELGRTGVGRLQLPDWLMADDKAWSSDVHGGPHHMGTTRMTADARTGVVDANCKVHGIDNLYIAGSSVFPTGGTANPTLTIVALAARLASHIKEHTIS